MTDASIPDPRQQLETAPAEERAVWDALLTVEDPELPVSIVDLGLVYDVSLEGGHATVEMTLTYSGCPAREMIVDDVERAVTSVSGVDSVEVDLVYSPPWSTDHITDVGRDELSEWGLALPEKSSTSGAACTQ
ncbi:metal-sulfur cluster assembly factor [Natrarchaeobius chitinivorans]|uniref:Metal-sulfur cluster assembly factor n=1 Tax=Natrarchaeobius chitinivorans TaxID=1679083 RepID=A0A3N6PD38_NATCH|nr:metal-sulfur cluster assembly factor [Natrarchaeobius chitinivorans]RQG94825.1 metal-sulfur cluster assembly factor [Natrarchaeobius chitinivorans]